MPKFMTAGKASAIRGSVQRTILDQGGGAAYTEGQRPLVDQLAKSVEDFISKVPGDGHVSVSGYFTQSGNTLDALVEIHANDVNLATDTGYTEPASEAKIDGSGANRDGAARDTSMSSREAQASVTGEKFARGGENDPFANSIAGSREVTIAREPVPQAQVPSTPVGKRGA